MMGLAQSRDETNRWMEDAIRYRAPRAVGRGPRDRTTAAHR